jgi:hypothetical protein
MNEYFKMYWRQATMAVAILACFGSIGWSIWSRVAPNSALEAANDPIFIDAKTGYVFRCKLTAGMSYPVISPDTGQRTGYEAELCYWTKDGQVKKTPTPVLLNQFRGISGPTFCPDCGRLVVAHNPMAVEGHKPPPTEAEYWATHPRPTTAGQ